jgi:uroporphyrinogen III methyltransferase / synthase
MVYLVGAGPGEAGLFTLRGVEVLGRAEVVIYDGLVNRELLRFAPPTAEIIYGGKHDRTRCVSQAELNALLLSRALAGKRVVRLKGGDPFMFGRGGEEAEVLAAAGVPFEVVPARFLRSRCARLRRHSADSPRLCVRGHRHHRP